MKLSACLLALALTACGLKEPLEPAPGDPAPAASAQARRAPTSEELLAVSPIARPERVGELRTRSEEREQDRFDLPPPAVPEGGDTVEGDEEKHRASDAGNSVEGDSPE